MKANDDYQVVGFTDDDEARQGLLFDDLPILGKSDNLRELIKKYEINKVIVATSDEIKPSVFQELVHAKFNGVAVYEMPTFYEKIAGRIPVLHTSNMWLGYADISGIQKNIYNTKLKMILDKAIASICFVIALPLMILTAIAIKLESKGSVFYKQSRVGWDEKEFALIKFRSMQMNAELNGAVWAEINDPRATCVGKVIRLLRIDELPQLWNVLKGEMSFVGPRPERPEFVKKLKDEIPYYTLRHSVKPGITGWAQINYGYGASTKDALEKLQYDLYYVKNESFLLDIYIMLRTFRVMLRGSGAR
jgi:sugar transferase (PEP-CTERM system associated)